MATRAYWLSGTSVPGDGEGWQVIKKANDQPASDDDKKTTKPDDLLNALRGQVQDVLECEHVMVLLGLGASLYLKPADGSRVRNPPRNTVLPSMSDLWNVVQTKASAEFEHISNLFPRHIPDSDKPGNIEALLTDCQMYASLFQGSDDNKADVEAAKKFAERAAELIAEECSEDLGKYELSAHELLVRALNRRDSKKPRPEIYTTNYDMCVEHACGETDTLVLDGFGLGGQKHYSPATLDMDITERMPGEREMRPHPSVLRLYKLHGSVNWFETDGRIRRGDPNEKGGTPVMIYPRGQKYRDAFRQPFLEMMARFQSGLRRRSVGLIVIGFGFNDDHLSEPIWMALRHNPSLRLVVADPNLSTWGSGDPGTDGRPTYRQRIAQLAHEQNPDARVTLVNAVFGGDLPSMTQGEGNEGKLRGDYTFADVLPAIGGKTSREIAEQRLRAIEKMVGGGGSR